MQITDEAQKAYNSWLNEGIDCDIKGNTITRRDAGWDSPTTLLGYCAGYEDGKTRQSLDAAWRGVK